MHANSGVIGLNVVVYLSGKLYFSTLSQCLNFAQWRYTNQWSFREVVLLLVENWIPIPRLKDVKYRSLCQFLMVSLKPMIALWSMWYFLIHHVLAGSLNTWIQGGLGGDLLFWKTKKCAHMFIWKSRVHKRRYRWRWHPIFLSALVIRSET